MRVSRPRGARQSACLDTPGSAHGTADQCQDTPLCSRWVITRSGSVDDQRDNHGTRKVTTRARSSHNDGDERVIARERDRAGHRERTGPGGSSRENGTGRVVARERDRAGHQGRLTDHVLSRSPLDQGHQGTTWERAAPGKNPMKHLVPSIDMVFSSYPPKKKNKKTKQKQNKIKHKKHKKCSTRFYLNRRKPIPVSR